MSSNPDETSILHFPHRTSVLKCWMFSLFYYLVLKTEPTSDQMFPLFSDTVKFGEKGTESKVSDKFRKCWAGIYKLAREYMHEDNDPEKLHEAMTLYGIEMLAAAKGCHAPKKKGVQELGDSNLAPQVKSHIDDVLTYVILSYVNIQYSDT